MKAVGSQTEMASKTGSLFRAGSSLRRDFPTTLSFARVTSREVDQLRSVGAFLEGLPVSLSYPAASLRYMVFTKFAVGHEPCTVHRRRMIFLTKCTACASGMSFREVKTNTMRKYWVGPGARRESALDFLIESCDSAGGCLLLFAVMLAIHSLFDNSANVLGERGDTSEKMDQLGRANLGTFRYARLAIGSRTACMIYTSVSSADANAWKSTLRG